MGQQDSLVALYASRAGADVTIIESGAPGGKLNLTAHIENYPGIKRDDVSSACI